MGWFFADKFWYYFDAWVRTDSGWRPVYERGWMRLTPKQAEVEYMDTVEAFWDGFARRFRWDGDHEVMVRDRPA